MKLALCVACGAREDLQHHRSFSMLRRRASRSARSALWIVACLFAAFPAQAETTEIDFLTLKPEEWRAWGQVVEVVEQRNIGCGNLSLERIRTEGSDYVLNLLCEKYTPGQEPAMTYTPLFHAKVDRTSGTVAWDKGHPGSFVPIPDLPCAPRMPCFKDYPARIYTGPGAPAILDTKFKRYMRTRLREGAKDYVNYAGHYVRTWWGCGSPCRQSMMIDKRTGRVFNMPEDYSEWDLSYQANSRLLVTSNMPPALFPDCETVPKRFYYVMEDGSFRLVKTTTFPGKRWALDTEDEVKLLDKEKLERCNAES